MKKKFAGMIMAVVIFCLAIAISASGEYAFENGDFYAYAKDGVVKNEFNLGETIRLGLDFGNLNGDGNIILKWIGSDGISGERVDPYFIGEDDDELIIFNYVFLNLPLGEYMFTAHIEEWGKLPKKLGEVSVVVKESRICSSFLAKTEPEKEEPSVLVPIISVKIDPSKTVPFGYWFKEFYSYTVVNNQIIRKDIFEVSEKVYNSVDFNQLAGKGSIIIEWDCPDCGDPVVWNTPFDTGEYIWTNVQYYYTYTNLALGDHSFTVFIQEDQKNKGWWIQLGETEITKIGQPFDFFELVFSNRLSPETYLPIEPIDPPVFLSGEAIYVTGLLNSVNTPVYFRFSFNLSDGETRVEDWKFYNPIRYLWNGSLVPIATLVGFMSNGVSTVTLEYKLPGGEPVEIITSEFEFSEEVYNYSLELLAGINWIIYNGEYKRKIKEVTATIKGKFGWIVGYKPMYRLGEYPYLVYWPNNPSTLKYIIPGEVYIINAVEDCVWKY